MTKQITDPKTRQVGDMFGRIVARYDLMNTIMTLGLDRSWRRLTAELAAVPDGGRALDVACGTGELTLAMAREGSPGQVVGVDIAPEMLAYAREKAQRAGLDKVATFAPGNALSLPFADESFDAVTVGFGLRNFTDLKRALQEMRRVLKPGGRLVSLELVNMPLLPFLWTSLPIYLHLRVVVPILGRLVTGDPEAYSYLPRSIEHFPTARGLAALMTSIRLRSVRYRSLGLGAVAVHVGIK